MTPREPDGDLRLPLLRQAWRTVTFVHWRYEKSLLQPLLPPGLTVDEHDGSAWVTLTPLEMRDVRLRGTPAVPRLSTFLETNLRTYVRDPDGRPGIWFFSLDAASTWITVGARLLLGAPYFRARLRLDRGDGIRYGGARAGRRRPAYHLQVRPGQDLQPGALDLWLTSRWRAYTRHAGYLLEIPVRHEAWRLRTASIARLDESLTASAGLPAPPRSALAHYSEGVADVEFGIARAVTRRRR